MNVVIYESNLFILYQLISEKLLLEIDERFRIGPLQRALYNKLS